MGTGRQLAVTFDDVLQAAERLNGVVTRTPVMTSRTLNDLSGYEVYLKCESFQRGGAFKFRGAYNAIVQIPEDQRTAGVVASSSGNHAQGVALSAKLLGIPAVIVMPTDAPTIKQEATRGYGAEIVFYDRQERSGEEYQYEVAAERGMTTVHPYDDPAIIAGQGTAALELLQDVRDLDTLIAPIGGGGLMAGAAIAARGVNPGIRLFGAETLGADDTKQSLDRHERVRIPVPTTIADGIRLTTPGELTFPIMQSLLADVLVVTDEQVLEALRFVITRMKLVIEPSGAVPIAAILQGLLPAGCRRVGVIVSGGNIDPGLLGRLWE